jgi:hypothetical protein
MEHFHHHRHVRLARRQPRIRLASENHRYVAQILLLAQLPGLLELLLVDLVGKDPSLIPHTPGEQGDQLPRPGAQVGHGHSRSKVARTAEPAKPGCPGPVVFLVAAGELCGSLRVDDILEVHMDLPLGRVLLVDVPFASESVVCALRADRVLVGRSGPAQRRQQSRHDHREPENALHRLPPSPWSSKLCGALV